MRIELNQASWTEAGPGLGENTDSSLEGRSVTTCMFIIGHCRRMKQYNYGTLEKSIISLISSIQKLNT